MVPFFAPVEAFPTHVRQRRQVRIHSLFLRGCSGLLTVAVR
jgi:hypothetical protein